jgi:hypothetical protein
VSKENEEAISRELHQEQLVKAVEAKYSQLQVGVWCVVVCLID